eukprot:TRINITY_DN6845_c0_g2_i1.p1 TRINITY_DN6845_c0_g2~~TRINITY_DN6845_c0_g2_i1.p1  ORF type:complete len:185 (-),score=26.04 TRINITY_DN6845_c0_g2_i1:16-570(-)
MSAATSAADRKRGRVIDIVKLRTPSRTPSPRFDWEERIPMDCLSFHNEAAPSFEHVKFHSLQGHAGCNEVSIEDDFQAPSQNGMKASCMPSGAHKAWADQEDDISAETRSHPDAIQKRFSRGSVGHPFTCAAACKFTKRIKGCQEGVDCDHCHLCVWKRSFAKHGQRAFNTQQDMLNGQHSRRF